MLEIQIIVYQFHYLLIFYFSFWLSCNLNDKLSQLHDWTLIFSNFSKTFILNTCIVFPNFKNSQKRFISNRFVLFVLFFFLDKTHLFLDFPHTAVKSVFNCIVRSILNKTLLILKEFSQLNPFWSNFYVFFKKNLVLLGAPFDHPSVVLFYFFVFGLVCSLRISIIFKDFFFATANCTWNWFTISCSGSSKVHQRHIQVLSHHSAWIWTFLFCKHRNIYQTFTIFLNLTWIYSVFLMNKTPNPK